VKECGPQALALEEGLCLYFGCHSCGAEPPRACRSVTSCFTGTDLGLLSRQAKSALSCDRKFWCKSEARHVHTTKALAVPPLLAAMGYEQAQGGWKLRQGARNFY